MNKCGCGTDKMGKMDSLKEDLTINGKKCKFMEQDNNDTFSVYITDENQETISPTYSVNCSKLNKGVKSTASKLSGAKENLKSMAKSDAEKWLSGK